MAEFDTGLLVINGVGNHPPTQTLEAIVEPLLARMRAEGVLVDSFATELGDRDEPGGTFDAIDVEYRTKPSPSGSTRHLRIVEGRWQGLYRKADAPKMSAWIYARQTRMVWEVVRYLSRSFGGFLLSASFLALAITALALPFWHPPLLWISWIMLTVAIGVGLGTVYLEHEGPILSKPGTMGKKVWTLFLFWQSPQFLLFPVFALLLVLAISGFAGLGRPPAGLLLLGALALALAISLYADVRDLWSDQESLKGRSMAFGQMIISAPLFLVYTTMRAVVVVGALIAIVVFLFITPLIRLLASVPFTSRLNWWVVSKFETALFTGGFADMESVLNNHVATAAMRSRLRKALSETRCHVRKDGLITVVVHSGGAPLAWELLSSNQLTRELETGPTGHRFRLLTVGAGLNWARRGLKDRDATPIDRPLVTGGPALTCKTQWLNIYSTWDPTPHGPVPVDEWPFFDGASNGYTWESMLPDVNPPKAANLLVRNLGAPVREEHREYWSNQEQVVPLLGWAIDPDVEWSKNNSGPKWRAHWSNVRLALISPLVRVRIILVGCVVAILVTAFSSDDPFHSFLSGPDNLPDIPFFDMPNLLGISRKQASCADNTFRVVDGAISKDCQSVPEHDNDGGLQTALEYLSQHDTLGSAAAVATTVVLAYLVMNLYTNLFWSQLARGPLPFGVKGPTNNINNYRIQWPLTLWVVVVIPFLLSLVVLAFDLPMWPRVTLISVTASVGICECIVLWGSVRAARDTTDMSLWRAYQLPLGRSHPPPAGQRKTTSGAVLS
jgi:hypothetical protein